MKLKKWKIFRPKKDLIHSKKDPEREREKFESFFHQFRTFIHTSKLATSAFQITLVPQMHRLMIIVILMMAILLIVQNLCLSLSLILESSSNLSDHLYTDQTFQLTEIEKERVRDRNGSTRIFIFSSLQDQKITKIPTDGMCQRCSTLAASGDAPSKTERIGNEKCDTRS